MRSNGDSFAEIRRIGDILSRAASRGPTRTGLIVDDTTIDYGTLDRAANRFANALAARGGPPGRRLLILCRNLPIYPIAYFGAARTRWVSVHLSPRAAAGEIAHVLAQTEAAMVLADVTALVSATDAARGLPEAPLLVAAETTAATGSMMLDAFLGAATGDAPPAAQPDPADPCCITFTGGTTGRPKGTIASHRARTLSTVAAVEDFPLHADDICAVTTPLCHAAGLFTWYQTAVLAGAACVLMQKWDAAAFVAAVEAHGITAAFLVPAQIALLLAAQGLSANRLATLRMIAYGGAPAPDGLIARAEAALPHVAFVQAFGSTETGHLLCQQPAERARHPTGIGRPGRRIEVAVMASPDRPAAVGEVGELASRGTQLMDGYLGEPDETAAFFRGRDGWGFTGDLAVRHADGTIALVGRAKEVIITGGINIYPAEVEAALAVHPAVADCAAFGLPDPTWGEIVAAAVVLKPGLSATTDELGGLTATRLGRHRRVRRVEFVDTLPRTAAGKVQRRLLAERFAGAASATD